jgi:hypothetical protein
MLSVRRYGNADVFHHSVEGGGKMADFSIIADMKRSRAQKAAGSALPEAMQSPEAITDRRADR